MKSYQKMRMASFILMVLIAVFHVIGLVVGMDFFDMYTIIIIALCIVIIITYHSMTLQDIEPKIRELEEKTYKYVVLEHLDGPDKGRRFWTTSSDNNTHSFRGELWYKEVMFTDSEEEATLISQIYYK